MKGAARAILDHQRFNLPLSQIKQGLFGLLAATYLTALHRIGANSMHTDRGST